MASTNPTCLVEWLTLVVKGIVEQHSHLFVLSERSAENTYCATLLATIKLDENRTGLRKFVVAGVDTEGQSLQAEQIPSDLELLSAELGVVSRCLHSNGEPSVDARARLTDLGILHVQVQGGEYSAPDSELCDQFGQLLLGGLPVREAVEALDQLTQQSKKTIGGQDARAALQGIFRATVALCLSEEAVWSPDSAIREHISASQYGERSEMSFGYGMKRYPAGDAYLEYYFPNCATLLNGQRQALNLYSALLHIDAGGEFDECVTLLQQLTRDLIDYFNSWLLGLNAAVAVNRITHLVHELRRLPHQALLGDALADASPLDQLHLLDFICIAKLRGAAGAVLSVLGNASPKTQEACIDTLIALDAVPEVDVIAPYAESPRSAVVASAVRALAAIATEESAKRLVEMMQTGKLAVNEVSLLGLAKTHTQTALSALVNLCATARGNVPPMALEECIDHFLPQVENGELNLRGDKNWLLRVATEMYEQEEYQILCRRVALKILRLFRIENAIDLLHRALSDRTIRTRISAMKCAAAFPSEENAQAIVQSANRPPDDYEQAKLVEWVMATMEIQSKTDGPAGRINSQGDLDLASAARSALAQMGRKYQDRYVTNLIAVDASNQRSDNRERTTEVKSRDDEQTPTAVAQRELIYALPKGGYVWVSCFPNKDGEDVTAVATIIHHNKLDSTPSGPTAAAMLGGGLIMTMGTKSQIMEDVVRRCLRGQEPRLPTSAGMGEGFVKNFNTGEETRWGSGSEGTNDDPEA
jgi:hypothetical protein